MCVGAAEDLRPPALRDFEEAMSQGEACVPTQLRVAWCAQDGFAGPVVASEAKQVWMRGEAAARPCQARAEAPRVLYAPAPSTACTAQAECEDVELAARKAR